MSARKTTRPGPRGPRLAPLAAMALAVVVALRVIAAPLVIAAPAPGLIAICSGGQIHYVSLDGTPVDPETGKPDTCPFLGVSLAFADPSPAIPAPRVSGLRLVHATAPDVLPLIRTARANPPRAPPLAT